MNGHLIFGYSVGFMLLWGYALLLFLESRTIRKQEHRDSKA